MLETMKRILTMAGKYRHKITIGIIISLLHLFGSGETNLQVSGVRSHT